MPATGGGNITSAARVLRIIRARSGLRYVWSETERPRPPAPVDSVPINVRPVDRKRLPILGAIIAISSDVTMGIAPMTLRGWLVCDRRGGRPCGFLHQP